jgi:hypothetical protein
MRRYWSHIGHSGLIGTSIARFVRICGEYAAHDTNISILSNCCHFGGGSGFVGLARHEILLQSGRWCRESTICQVGSCGANLAQHHRDCVTQKLERCRKVENLFLFHTSRSIIGIAGTRGTANQGESTIKPYMGSQTIDIHIGHDISA